MRANLEPVRLRRPFMAYVLDGGGRLRGHLSSTSWKIFFRFCESFSWIHFALLILLLVNFWTINLGQNMLISAREL